MDQRMRAILESKRLERGRLRHLPLDERIAILEKMRDRALAIAGSSLAKARRHLLDDGEKDPDSGSKA